MKEDKKKNSAKWFYWFTFAVAIIIVYKTLDNFSEIGIWFSNLFSVLTPFIIGILLAYILFIPVKKLEMLFKRTKKRSFINRKAKLLSIILVYIILILFIIILFKVVVPIISISIIDLINNFQNYYDATIKAINELPEDSILKSQAVFNIIAEAKNIDLKNYVNVEKVTQYAQGIINFATGIVHFFIAIIVSFYILLQRSEMLEFTKKFIGATFKEKTYKNIDKYFNRTNEIFFKYISSQLLDAIVVGIFTSIAMLIMDVKYAVLLGFLIGLFNLIPYFGAIIAVALAILITMLTGGIPQAIWTGAVLTIIQQIDANIINPRIVSGSLKISPLLVIFAVTIGGAYFGILGMFLAVPIISVIKLLLTDYIEIKNNINK